MNKRLPKLHKLMGKTHHSMLDYAYIKNNVLYAANSTTVIKYDITQHQFDEKANGKVLHKSLIKELSKKGIRDIVFQKNKIEVFYKDGNTATYKYTGALNDKLEIVINKEVKTTIIDMDKVWPKDTKNILCLKNFIIDMDKLKRISKALETDTLITRPIKLTSSIVYFEAEVPDENTRILFITPVNK